MVDERFGASGGWGMIKVHKIGFRKIILETSMSEKASFDFLRRIQLTFPKIRFFLLNNNVEAGE